MFYKGDYVNYSTSGICQIEDICFMSFGKNSKGHDYYILKPVSQEGESIFVPIDNEKLIDRMKPVLTPKEIDDIILSIKDEDLIWIDDRKQRIKKFHDILLKRDEKELLMLASCLYLRSTETKKGISSTEQEILKTAESAIDQEFSFVLHLSAQDIGIYIRKKLGIE